MSERLTRKEIIRRASLLGLAAVFHNPGDRLLVRFFAKLTPKRGDWVRATTSPNSLHWQVESTVLVSNGHSYANLSHPAKGQLTGVVLDELEVVYDFHSGQELGTVAGLREADIWLRGFAAAQTADYRRKAS
jgi:hypothetical protein